VNSVYGDLLKYLGAEALVLAAALAALFVGLWSRGRPAATRRGLAAAVALAGCGAAAAWLLLGRFQGTLLDGMLTMGPLTRWVKLIILGMGAGALCLAASGDWAESAGEFVAVMLLALIGLLLMVSTENLLLAFLALELASLSLYILTALNGRCAASLEAALKYFFYGSVCAGFLLFGLSLLYGLAGSLQFRAMASSLGRWADDPAALAALAMVAVGFGFKIAAAPFYSWAPDVYQAAPTPAAALIASGSKVAGVFLLARFFVEALPGMRGAGALTEAASGWAPLWAVLAVASMTLGNLGALAQRSFKRLLAYSAVAHAGYMLVGVSALGAGDEPSQTTAAVLYYAITYALAALGAFGVAAALEAAGCSDDLSRWAGLSRRSPQAGVFLMIFMLSLAGVPPLVGFFGKFYVFRSAAAAEPRLGLLWLVIVGAGWSAVSLYYYLRVLKQAFVAAPPEDAPPIRLGAAPTAVLLVAAALVVLWGVAPDLLLSKISAGLAP